MSTWADKQAKRRAERVARLTLAGRTQSIRRTLRELDKAQRDLRAHRATLAVVRDQQRELAAQLDTAVIARRRADHVRTIDTTALVAMAEIAEDAEIVLLSLADRTAMGGAERALARTLAAGIAQRRQQAWMQRRAQRERLSPEFQRDVAAMTNDERQDGEDEDGAAAGPPQFAP